MPILFKTSAALPIGQIKGLQDHQTFSCCFCFVFFFKKKHFQNLKICLIYFKEKHKNNTFFRRKVGTLPNFPIIILMILFCCELYIKRWHNVSRLRFLNVIWQRGTSIAKQCLHRTHIYVDKAKCLYQKN